MSAFSDHVLHLYKENAPYVTAECFHLLNVLRATSIFALTISSHVTSLFSLESKYMKCDTSSMWCSFMFILLTFIHFVFLLFTLILHCRPVSRTLFSSICKSPMFSVMMAVSSAYLTMFIILPFVWSYFYSFSSVIQSFCPLNKSWTAGLIRRIFVLLRFLLVYHLASMGRGCGHCARER